MLLKEVGWTEWMNNRLRRQTFPLFLDMADDICVFLKCVTWWKISLYLTNLYASNSGVWVQRLIFAHTEHYHNQSQIICLRSYCLFSARIRMRKTQLR